MHHHCQSLENATAILSLHILQWHLHKFVNTPDGGVSNLWSMHWETWLALRRHTHAHDWAINVKDLRFHNRVLCRRALLRTVTFPMEGLPFYVTFVETPLNVGCAKSSLAKGSMQRWSWFKTCFTRTWTCAWKNFRNASCEPISERFFFLVSLEIMWICHFFTKFRLASPFSTRKWWCCSPPALGRTRNFRIIDDFMHNRSLSLNPWLCLFDFSP